MFTGIVRCIGKIVKNTHLPGFTEYSISMPKNFLSHLEKGASVSIDGVCLTVVSFTSNEATFDAIDETLSRTALKSLKEGDLVNLERAARFGDEVGGHILSGHIFGTATIHSIDRTGNQYVVYLKCPVEWTKYLFPKGYIALNGASLTLVDIDKTHGIFSVHLIPETLKNTTFEIKKINDPINVELDTQTQIIVDTLENLFKV